MKLILPSIVLLHLLGLFLVFRHSGRRNDEDILIFRDVQHVVDNYVVTADPSGYLCHSGWLLSKSSSHVCFRAMIAPYKLFGHLENAKTGDVRMSSENACRFMCRNCSLAKVNNELQRDEVVDLVKNKNPFMDVWWIENQENQTGYLTNNCQIINRKGEIKTTECKSRYEGFVCQSPAHFLEKCKSKS